MAKRLELLGRRLALTPGAAIALAVALIALSLGLALYNERVARDESVRQARVQVEILAGSLAAPLAFDDRAAAQDYLDALRANPAIEAAGAYNEQGRLAASYRRAGAPPPAVNGDAAVASTAGKLIVTAPAMQGTTRLGSVYLRLSTETVLRRALRYLGIGAVIVMASLLVATLGAAHGRLRETHRRLLDQIQERERAEEALRQSQKMEAMGQLTGGVAHDFNNLLMVASSGLDLMDRTTDPVRRDHLKQAIRQAIDRGASLTQQLLAFARRAPVRPEVIDLGASLRGMRVLLERALREDITVDLEIADDLWPVEVDPSQLEVAVLNTAINARDAMPGGGAIVVKAVNAPATPDHPVDRVQLCVIDTGAGVPADVIPRVFEPFFTTKSVGAGTGLGLSQVYGFASSSGGAVDFRSQVGVGSTVCIHLPRSFRPLPRVMPTPPGGPRSDQPRHVLLVEDDDKIAELVGDMLDALGYDFTRAANAAAALEVLARAPSFDLVFSDMVMPGEMNGLELAEAIAHQRPDLPIVLTTGYSNAATSAAAKGIRLLVKPYRMEALDEELRAALADIGKSSAARG
jgi:signal transduction histidine kinase/ActR/RegA family two-component response regulator